MTRCIIFIPMIALAACNPPPTDAGMDREVPVAEPTFASEPQPSPDTQNAKWVAASETRIVYGTPGEPALLALQCDEAETVENNRIAITRISLADEGAGAIMALIGNEQIGRIEVDATEIGGRFLWHGAVKAGDERLAPLIGEEEATATVPGGGMVTLNASALPGQFIAKCRGTPLEAEVELPVDDGATAPAPQPQPAR